MLGYPALYAVFNLFLEDLNRYCAIGDVVSKLLAMAGFGFNIWLGFWVLAKRGSLSMGSDGVLGLMAGILISGLLLKIVKERCILGRTHYINIWLGIAALVSIGLAAILQEKILHKWIPLPCDPQSVFQGHAGWHVFSATALFLGFYIFYSEEEENSSFEGKPTVQTSKIEAIQVDMEND